MSSVAGRREPWWLKALIWGGEAVAGVWGGLVAIDFGKAAGNILLGHYAKAWRLMHATVLVYGLLIGFSTVFLVISRRLKQVDKAKLKWTVTEFFSRVWRRG